MMKKFRLLLLIVLSVFCFSLVACDYIFDNGQVNWNISDDTEENNINDNKNDDNTNDNNTNNDNNGEITHHNQTINFFTMNDIHGQLISDKEEGTIGLDRVTTILNSLEKNDDYIKLTTGDMFQGSYFTFYS